MEYIQKAGFFVFLMIVFNNNSMNISPSKNSIYVMTSDGALTSIERWKVQEIKVLLVLLEHQKGNNSVSNPIKASMISSQELDLLNKSFVAIEQGKFESFLDTMITAEGEKFFTAQEKANVKEDILLRKELGRKASLRSGILRTLINAAASMEANIISSFCLTYTVSSDLQSNQFTGDLINSVISLSANPQILSGHSGEVMVAAFSPDGTKLISGSKGQSNNLILWDISGRKSKQLKILNGHPHEVTAAVFSHDGKNIVSGCIGQHNNLILWDWKKGIATSLAGHIAGVNAITFKNKDSQFASGGLDETNNIIIWDLETKKALKVLSGNPTGIECFLFSPDNNKLLSGGANKKNDLLLSDLNIPENSQFLNGLRDTITTIDFSPDGQKIIAGCQGSIPNLFLWDLVTGKSENLSSKHSPGIRIDTTTAAVFSRDGKKIMSARIGTQDNLTLWNASTLMKDWVIPGFSDGVWSATFNQHQNKIIACGLDHNRSKIMVADIAAKHCQDLYYHQDPIMAVICNPNGKSVVGRFHHDKGNLVLISLLLDEEEKALHQCTFAQAYFIYRLFLMITHRLNIDFTSPTTKSIYNSLPDVIKKMIYRYMDQEQIISLGSTIAKKKKKFHISSPFSRDKKK